MDELLLMQPDVYDLPVRLPDIPPVPQTLRQKLAADKENWTPVAKALGLLACIFVCMATAANLIAVVVFLIQGHDLHWAIHHLLSANIIGFLAPGLK